MHNNIKNQLIWLDRLIRVSFYALIFFLPISIALVSTFSAFALFFFIVKRVLSAIDKKAVGFKFVAHVFQLTPSLLDWPLLSFIGAVIVSVIFSQYQALSAVSFFGKVLRGIYLYCSFLEAFREIRHINNFIFCWLLSAFTAGLSGINQYLNGFDFLRNTPLVGGRIASSLRHSNDFGAYLVAVCPLMLVILLCWESVKTDVTVLVRKIISDKGLFLFLYLVVTAVLIICLGLTFSRSSWVAFFLSFIIAAFYKKRTIPAIVAILIVFSFFFSPAMIKARNVSMVTDSVSTTQPIATVEANLENNGIMHNIVSYVYNYLGNGRWGFWNESLRIINDYPVWGAGLNTYSLMGPKYREAWGGYPHNSYLQMTAELGILGLGSFLWIIWSLFSNSFVFIRTRIKFHEGVLLLGVITGLCAILIQSFFDTTFYSVQLSVLMWLMIALAAAIQRLTKTTG